MRGSSPPSVHIPDGKETMLLMLFDAHQPIEPVAFTSVLIAVSKVAIVEGMRGFMWRRLPKCHLMHARTAR
jgi:hypothetical protein